MGAEEQVKVKDLWSEVEWLVVTGDVNPLSSVVPYSDFLKDCDLSDKLFVGIPLLLLKRSIIRLNTTSEHLLVHLLYVSVLGVLEVPPLLVVMHALVF